jgi:uroporphyrinogen decarboxylase
MSAAMTGRERVLAVLQRQEPDRIPTFEWDVDPGLIQTMTGGGTYEDFIEQFDLDAVMCGPTYAKRPLPDNRLIDEWGVTRERGHEAYAVAVDALAPLSSMADLERWQPPDPHAPGRFDVMKERIRRFKGQRAIFVQLRDVWSNPRDLLGYTNLLMMCLTEPELVEALVVKCIDQSIALLEIAAGLGAEVVMSGDDIADNRRTLISPAVWDRLFMPHFRRWVAAIHDRGLYYWKHTDGNIQGVLDMLVDAGIDGIDPIDPVAGMDLATVKREWGSRIAIKGNVDCASVLVDGTPADVVEAVKACIRAAGPGGGYACSSSNSIHSGVKPALYRTMVDAIREYGTYPLDQDRLAASR